MIVRAPVIPASACPAIVQMISYSPGSRDERSSVSDSPAARSAVATSVPLTARLCATEPVLVTSTVPPAETDSAAGVSANSFSSRVAASDVPPTVEEPSRSYTATTVAMTMANTASTTANAAAPKPCPSDEPDGEDAARAPFGKPDDAGSLSVLGGSLVSTGRSVL